MATLNRELEQQCRGIFHALERPAGRGYVDERLSRALFASLGVGPNKGADPNEMMAQFEQLVQEAGAPSEEVLSAEEVQVLPHVVPEDQRVTVETWLERMASRQKRFGTSKFIQVLQRLDSTIFEKTGVCTSSLVAFGGEWCELRSPQGAEPRVAMAGVVNLLVRAWVSEYEEDASEHYWKDAQKLRKAGKIGEAIDLEQSNLSAIHTATSVFGFGWIAEPDLDTAIMYQTRVVEQLSKGTKMMMGNWKPHPMALETGTQGGPTRLENAIKNLEQMKDGTYKW